MDWMYANCSTTAQRGALDWKEPFRKATAPVFKKLYASVKSGKEAKISIESNSKKDYSKNLAVELKAIRDSEMWQAGKKVRDLRPERQSDAKPKAKKAAKKKVAKKTAAKKK